MPSPRSDRGLRATVAHDSVVVSIDPSRCEMHLQCDGLSRRILRGPDYRLRLAVGPGGDATSRGELRRMVASCPMAALSIEPHETPQPPSDPHQELR